MQPSSTIFNRTNYYPADEVQLVYSGSDYFNKLQELIQAANTSLYFQTYIYDEDATGILIANALKTAARRGVRIYMLIDAFGSKELSKKFIADLQGAGIHLRMFAPFFSKNTIHLGRRMHHKIVVADDDTALVGGINISDKYRGSATERAWLDYAILVKGNVCEQLSKICLTILRRRFPILKKKPETKTTISNSLVRFRQNDRLRGKKQISKSYLQAIRAAEHSIVFVSSYFLPGRRILKALKKASESGVQVVIILSANSDIILFGKATSHLYASLMKQGIQIYEWQQSILHGKIAMVDEKWVTIGSFNLNYLSALSSIELNVEVMDATLVNQLQQHIQEVIQTGCKKIDYDLYIQSNTWRRRMINTTAYYLTRGFMKSLALFPKLFSRSKED
jgi:cardiolipin synthase